jgi:hypothetical protein
VYSLRFSPCKHCIQGTEEDTGYYAACNRGISKQVLCFRRYWRTEKMPLLLVQALVWEEARLTLLEVPAFHSLSPEREEQPIVERQQNLLCEERFYLKHVSSLGFW